MKYASLWYLLLLNPFILSIFVLGCGLTRWRDVSRYGVLRTFAYAQVAQQAPAEGWKRITGCRIDLSQAIIETQNGAPRWVYVPVFDRNDVQQRTTRIFAEMDDSATLKLMLERNDMEKQHSPQELAAWMNAHREAFLRFGDVTGLAQQGIRGEALDWDSTFAGIAAVPVAQLVIVNSGWEPNPGWARTQMGIGTVGILVCLTGFWWISRRR